jgi:hypothetical protein
MKIPIFQLVGELPSQIAAIEVDQYLIAGSDYVEFGDASRIKFLDTNGDEVKLVDFTDPIISFELDGEYGHYNVIVEFPRIGNETNLLWTGVANLRILN